ncbi:MAG: hypothetical protein WAT81_05095 [Candidatus Moraniibacteriota bacterium]
MWEFLSRNKEGAVTPFPESAPTPPRPEGDLTVEELAEQATEKVNEKYAAILSKADKEHASEPIIPDIHSDAEKLGQVIDTTSQVNQLVELAQVKGLAHAVTVARKLNDLYVLDMTHDQFVDKWYEALKAKGLVQGE